MTISRFFPLQLLQTFDNPLATHQEKSNYQQIQRLLSGYFGQFWRVVRRRIRTQHGDGGPWQRSGCLSAFLVHCFILLYILYSSYFLILIILSYAMFLLHTYILLCNMLLGLETLKCFLPCSLHTTFLKCFAIFFQSAKAPVLKDFLLSVKTGPVSTTHV